MECGVTNENRVYFILFLFFKRGVKGGRKRERNIDARNMNQLPLVHALTGDRTCSLDMCPDRNQTYDLSFAGRHPAD